MLRRNPCPACNCEEADEAGEACHGRTALLVQQEDGTFKVSDRTAQWLVCQGLRPVEQWTYEKKSYHFRLTSPQLEWIANQGRVHPGFRVAIWSDNKVGTANGNRSL